MTNISIVTIGDELLIGQVIDTNSAWMAQELNKSGFWVKRRVAIGDGREDILKTLQEESADADIILMTGGLGPTADDITKSVLCEYFNSTLVVNEEALENVKNIFTKIFKRPIILESNLKQAEVPAVCKVIQNKRGTAPGMLFEKDEKIYISMPGVPHEMKGMMTEDVIPFLKDRFVSSYISHRTLLTAGIGESSLADHISQFESSLPAQIKLAYLPGYGMVRLRLTANANQPDGLEQALDLAFTNLKSLVGEWLVTDEDITLQAALGKLLASRNQTVSTAESCTGGYVAHLITSIPGSSDYFYGSVIAYDNRVKKKMLGVDPAVLSVHGAVSEETVKAMVNGAIRNMETDFAVATSGIMGPGGGSEEKPVGTVWIAAGDAHEIITRKLWFRFDRQRNIELTAINVLNLLRIFILSRPLESRLKDLGN
ncbi:MAG TPA: competence/damage-inducible protein A [Puia sp.]|nr:competence/damage-inducible protein A [Puia sp.]